MITGGEMARIQAEAMRQVMRGLARSCHDGGDVNDACKEALRRGVHKFVYDVYSPSVYGRRYEGGGLADENNWITTTIAHPNSVSIDLEDMTPAGDAGMINPPPDPVFYLSDIIESGANGRRWHDPDWPGPRPYMEESMQDGCNGGGVIDRAIENVINALVLTV